MIDVNVSKTVESMLLNTTGDHGMHFNRSWLLAVIEHKYPECTDISINRNVDTGRVYISVYEQGIILIDELMFLSIEHLINATADEYQYIENPRGYYPDGDPIETENLINEIQKMLDIDLDSL